MAETRNIMDIVQDTALQQGYLARQNEGLYALIKENDRIAGPDQVLWMMLAPVARGLGMPVPENDATPQKILDDMVAWLEGTEQIEQQIRNDELL